MEEEEEGFEYYNEYPEISPETETLKTRWANFKASYPFPMYGMVLASQADSDTVELVTNHRSELSAIAGKRCCFIYFRSLDSAKVLKGFEFSEHANWVYPLVRIIGVDIDNLPCIIFFKDIDAGDFICLSLKGKSASEGLTIVREAFKYVQTKQNSKAFTSLRHYKNIQVIRSTAEKISKNALEIGVKVVAELINSLVKTP